MRARCHINLDKAKSLTWSQEPANVGGHTLHVMRVKDADGAIMLSCMLQYDPAKGAGLPARAQAPRTRQPHRRGHRVPGARAGLACLSRAARAGNYFPGKVEAFEKVMSKYGGELVL